MAQQPKLLLTKPCGLQQPDKSYAPGHILVREHDVVWQPTQPSGASQQTFLLSDAGVVQKAKGKPLLRVPLAVPLVFMFGSEDDREAVSVAITEAKSSTGPSTAAAAQQQPPARQPAPVSRPATPSTSASSVIPSKDERDRLLAQDSDLKHTYESLVATGAITESDFWQYHFINSGKAKLAANAASQTKGVPNPMLSILEMLPDGTEHKVQVTMTEAMRQQILDERPHIRRAHLANVPHNMSEHEFWERYVRNEMAKHARRHRQALQRNVTQDAAGDETAGIFVEDGAADDVARARAQRRRLNPALDLDANEGDAAYAGYGIRHNASRDEVDTAAGYKGPSAELVREYNAHGHVVLHGPERGTAAAALAGGAGPSKAGRAQGPPHGQSGLSEAEPGDEVLNRMKQEEVGLEDLQSAPEPHYEQLRIHNPRVYMEGGQGLPAQMQQSLSISSAGAGAGAGAGAAGATASEALAHLDPDDLADTPMAPATAQQVLLDVVGNAAAADGSVAQSRTLHSPSLVLPARQQAELRNLALVINELLRHFWGCIPVSTEPRRLKFERVQPALEQQYDQLKSRIENSREQRLYVLQLVRPMMEQMDCAFVAAQEVKKALQKKHKGASAKQPA